MAVSPENPEIQTNFKSEEDETTAVSKCNNDEGRKDNCDTIPSPDIDSSNQNQYANETLAITEASDHNQPNTISSTPITNEVDLATSPQNTVGLPCGESRSEAPFVANRENTRSTSVLAPPALPPRPANLQAPIVVNGLPHPPHAFNASQGRISMIITKVFDKND